MTLCLAFVAVWTLTACQRPDGQPGPQSGRGRQGGQTGGMMGGMMGGRRKMMRGAAQDTGAAPRPQVASAAAAAGCPAITRSLVDTGRAVFSGTGNCHTCHGADAKGTTLAPNLTDSTWLNIDGSYGAIASLVRRGVAAPKQYPAPMPPMGGASLDSAQLCAVAAYVYSLGHR